MSDETSWQDARVVLKRIPGTLEALLSGMPQEWIRAKEGPDSFSSFDVVAHLVDLEATDWVNRIQVIVDGGGRPFDPVDRFAFRRWADERSLEELLGLFAQRRRNNLHTVDQLFGESPDFSLPGTHPALGAVTLGQLVSTWVVHDLTHVAQVARVLAKRYKPLVGPWEAYLSVLHDRED